MNADALVFFGATGDLADKKIFPALHGMARHGHLDMPVVAVARSGWTLDQLRARAEESVERHGGVDRDAFAALMRALTYIDGDYADAATFARLDQELEGRQRPESTVETFVALRLWINSWRWKGVPFYIRAGKRLPVTASELVVKLRQAPAVFADTAPPANYFRFRLAPTHTIAISSFVKVPGDRRHGELRELTVTEQPHPGETSAYEELLTDAIHGVTARFTRQDYVEEAWRIVDPVLGDATPVYQYEPGTWGPPEADRIVPPLTHICHTL